MLSTHEISSLRLCTGWSDLILNSIRSVEEARIYVDAGLKECKFGRLTARSIIMLIALPGWMHLRRRDSRNHSSDNSKHSESPFND